MDLGNKTLNNLISKEFKKSKSAAADFIESADSVLFELLDKKSEFLFDFIIEKITSNLKSALNETNSKNLLEFAKVYSQNFKSFILDGFSRFNMTEDVKKFLKNGTLAQKAYALDFFIGIKDEDFLSLAKSEYNSDFEPIKISSIHYLASVDERFEYEKALNTLKDDSDCIEKLNACEFLAYFGDKNAFNGLYDYFISSGMPVFIAFNILLLLNIEEIEEDKAFCIFSSILRAYPDETSFDELNYYLEEGFLNLLIETQNESAAIFIFSLKYRLNAVLNDEAYLIDLSKNEKEKANILLEKIEVICKGYNLEETLKKALDENIIYTNLVALEMLENAPYFPKEDIINLCLNSKNEEVISLCAKTLSGHFELTKDIKQKALERINNEILKEEILSLA